MEWYTTRVVNSTLPTIETEGSDQYLVIGPTHKVKLSEIVGVSSSTADASGGSATAPITTTHTPSFYHRASRVAQYSEWSVNVLDTSITSWSQQTLRFKVKFGTDYRQKAAEFARDMITFGQDYWTLSLKTGTISGGTALDGLNDQVVKSFNKAIRYNGNPYFVLSAEADTASANLVLTSLIKGLRIEEAYIESYDSATMTWSKFVDLVEDQAWVEEFGTADFIKENIRIRTKDSIQPYTTQQDEIPVEGATYEQVTFKQKSVRDDLTTMFPVGGQSNSVSDFVFYVKSDIYNQATTGWAAVLAGAGSIIEVS